MTGNQVYLFIFSSQKSSMLFLGYRLKEVTDDDRESSFTFLFFPSQEFYRRRWPFVLHVCWCLQLSWAVAPIHGRIRMSNLFACTTINAMSCLSLRFVPFIQRASNLILFVFLWNVKRWVIEITIPYMHAKGRSCPLCVPCTPMSAFWRKWAYHGV